MCWGFFRVFVFYLRIHVFIFVCLFIYLFIFASFFLATATKTGVLDDEGEDRRVRAGAPAHDQLPGRPAGPVPPAAQLRAITPPWPRGDSDGVGAGQRRPLLPSGPRRPSPSRCLRCHPHGRARSRLRPPASVVVPADQEEASARKRRQRLFKPRFRPRQRQIRRS